MPRPLPVPSRWSAPFWEAAAQRRLTVQQCRSCDELIMFPKRLCPVCLGEDLGWLEVSGRGEVYTYTVQQAGPPSGFEDQVPYVLAIIKLAEGPQLMTTIVGEDRESVDCGTPVVVDWQEVEGVGPDGPGTAVLPVFRIAAPAPA